LFIYGQWGAPAMGAAGCGIASAIVMWVQLLLTLLMVMYLPQLRHIALFNNWQQPQWLSIKPLLKLGLPVALATTAEVALFSAVAFIIAYLGADVIAGHQIALSVSAMTFMLPLSLGLALTIQIGQYRGAKQADYARYICIIGMSTATLLALINMAVLILCRDMITRFYSNDPAIQLIATSLLFYAAIFQLPDAIQVCAASALRGYFDTHIPMLIMLFSYWVISIPLGWGLTHGFSHIPSMGAEGMWLGLVCGLSCAALLQGLRLHWRIRQ
jgi:MATE family, multidrug efflux pump